MPFERRRHKQRHVERCPAQGGDLTGVRLGLAKLGGANLTNACLKGVNFLRVNLASATMPDGVLYTGKRDPDVSKYLKIDCL